MSGRSTRSADHPSREDTIMRTNPTAISAAVVLLAAATYAVTGTASTAAPAPRQLTLTATTTHESLLNLSGTPDDPTGNQFVSAQDLYRGHRKVGAGAASCQIIDVVGPEQLRVQCIASLSLPAGQLSAQGLPVVDETENRPFTLAITGGTGAYAGAEGQVTVCRLDDQHSRYTITLGD
jgi:hypothetical protein